MCEARKHVGYWDIGCTMLMAEIRPTTSDSLLPYLRNIMSQPLWHYGISSHWWVFGDPEKLCQFAFFFGEGSYAS